MLFRAKKFLVDIYLKRAVIFELAKRDFQQQYMGSYLGFVWVFLQPLIFIGILYSVFTFGLRSGASPGMPYSLYLITGMVAWMFFSGTLSASAGIISSHAYLVNKVDFRLSILPIVKILSQLAVHLFFILLVFVLAWYHGYSPTWYSLQIVYYLFATVILLLGLGWLTSSTSLFVSDVTKGVSVIVQFGFWLTPILWDINLIPKKYQWILHLNPFCYIVQGYRESLVLSVPFWHHPMSTLYFWSCVLFILFAGITIFSKLRPHFAEVV